jgi:hypothetical protein
LADPGAVEAKAAQNRVLKKASENPKMKTSSLVDEFTDHCQDPGFRTRAVKVKLLQRQIQMRKAQALHSRKAPQTFDDLATIPDEFTVCMNVCMQTCRVWSPDFVSYLFFKNFLYRPDCSGCR